MDGTQCKQPQEACCGYNEGALNSLVHTAAAWSACQQQRGREGSALGHPGKDPGCFLWKLVLLARTGFAHFSQWIFSGCLLCGEALMPLNCDFSSHKSKMGDNTKLQLFSCACRMGPGMVFSGVCSEVFPMAWFPLQPP